MKNKLYIFIFLSLISSSGYSGKLDDIEDQLDSIIRHQRIQEVMNYLELNSYRRERDEVERLRIENELLREQLNSRQKSIGSIPNTESKPTRKFQNGECIVPVGMSEVNKTLKIVSFDDGNYTTNSYLTTKEGWIRKKDKTTYVESNSKRSGSSINNEYVSTNCPKHDSILNIDDYLNKRK